MKKKNKLNSNEFDLVQFIRLPIGQFLWNLIFGLEDRHRDLNGFWTLSGVVNVFIISRGIYDRDTNSKIRKDSIFFPSYVCVWYGCNETAEIV